MNSAAGSSPAAGCLSPYAGVAMRQLLDEGLAELPLPARGATLQRWQALATVGACDLALAKLYESHCDAVAILFELGAPATSQPAPHIRIPAGIGAIWAAESRQRLRWIDGHLHGPKSWCSGGDIADWALLTAWTSDDEPVLVQIDMKSAGIRHDDSVWQAVGMAGIRTPDLDFSGTPGLVVCKADAMSKSSYLGRAGFWQGGIGVAAAWYGAATAIAAQVRARCQDGLAGAAAGDPYKLAHLGAIDVALRPLRALFREAAVWIDANPFEEAQTWALRVRAVTDLSARVVVEHAGLALGAGPLCRDRAFAKRMADLPVFIRQTHAEQDLAALGSALAKTAVSGSDTWQL